MAYTPEMATKIARSIYNHWYSEITPIIREVDGVDSNLFTGVVSTIENGLLLIECGIIPIVLIPTTISNDLIKMQCFMKFCVDNLKSRPQHRTVLNVVSERYYNCLKLLSQIIDDHYVDGVDDLATIENDTNTDIECCKELSAAFGGIFIKPCDIIQFPTANISDS